MHRQLSVSFLTALLLAAGAARADNRSTFRVVGAELAGDKVQLNVAWQHNGAPEKVEFYAHKEIPGHNSKAVREGVLLKKFEMKEGPGTGKLKAELGALKDKLGLAPGEKLCVAATWPEISAAGHHWGTNMGGRWTEGTSVTIPAAAKNSALGRRGQAAKVGPLGPLRLGRCKGARWRPVKLGRSTLEPQRRRPASRAALRRIGVKRR